MHDRFFPHHEVYVGKDLGGRAVTIDAALARHYDRAIGGAESPRGVGDAAAVAPSDDGTTLEGGAAPALLFHSEVYRTLAWYLPNVFGNLHARQEWELFAPLPIGAAVRTRSTVVERYAKRNREYVVNEVLVTDLDGRWLQRSRTHQSFLADESRRDVVVDREREKRADRQFTTGEGDGAELPPLERTITIDMCEAFSGPEKNYHTDRAMAQALGFPDIVVQGMMSICFVSELLSRAFGVRWQLGGKLDVKLVNVVWVADMITTHAKVREELAEGSKRRVALDVWCEKQDGTKAIVGTASALR